MCFSATASVAAGTSLSIIGVATLRNTSHRTEIPFAMIPLLFGIQQLIEGVIWLTFAHEAPMLRQTMTYAYSAFSHVLWPVYVPLAIGVLEVTRWRRKVLAGFEVAGLTVGLYLLYIIVTRPVVAQVVSRHIEYISPHFYIGVVIVLYVAANLCERVLLEPPVRGPVRRTGTRVIRCDLPVLRPCAGVGQVLLCGDPERADVRAPALQEPGGLSDGFPRSAATPRLTALGGPSLASFNCIRCNARTPQHRGREQQPLEL